MARTQSQTRRDENPDSLFARYRETGDAAALGALFDATSRDLLRIALSLLPDAAAAEDAVQETFLAAIEFAGRWDASRPVVPWLVGVLRHKVEARRRDGARRVDEARVFTRLPPLDPAGAAELREDGERLRAAMDALPEPFRQAAILRWRHGLEPAEIAHLTGESPGAIRVRLHRALVRLRDRVRGGAALALLPPLGTSSGHGAPRGLDAVRYAVMSRARTAGPVGAAATAAGIVGGVLMTGKGAVAAVCVILAITGGVWWALVSDAPGGDAGTAHIGTGATVSDVRGHGRAPAPVVAAPAPPETSTAAAAAPVPVGPTISGRVIDPSGRGVGGARVVAVASGNKDLVRADALDTPTDVAASAITGTDGAFVVSARGGGRIFDLLATAAGFAPASASRVRTGTPVAIRLDAESVLRGRVVGPDGTPIAGAELRLTSVTAGGFVDRRVVLADAAGAFRLGGLAARTVPPWAAIQPVTQILTVRAEGFAPLRADVEPGADAAEREIVLFRGVPLTVTVTDGESGAPIDGATVSYGDRAVGLRVEVWRRFARSVPHPDPDLDVATTGPDGHAVFAAAPAERAGLRMFVRAWKAGWTAEAAATDLGGGVDALHVRIALWPSTTVRGRVVDASGAPVAGASVVVSPGAPDWFSAPVGDRPWPAGATTDADGRYVQSGARSGRVAPVELTLTATPPWGEGLGDVAFTSRDRVQVKVAATAGADTAAPDLVMGAPRPTPRAAVIVTDAAGSPIEDAAIESAGATLPVVRTGEGGRAVVRWHVDPALFPPSMQGPRGPRPERVLRVSAPGFASAVADVVPSAEHAPEVRVTLAPGRTLVVQARSLGGEPAAGAAVWATWGTGDGMHVAEGVPDGAGSFTFADLGAAPVTIHARGAPSWIDLPETVVPGVVAGGDPVHVVIAGGDVETGAVEGRVRDLASGAPVAGFEVEIPSAPYPVNTSGDALSAGTFRIDGVPVGTWPVRVRPHGRLAEDGTVTVARGATSRVEVTVSRGVPIVGRVRVPDGVALRTPRIDLRRIDLGPDGPESPGTRPWAWIQSDGTFRIAAARPGRYLAVATLHSGEPRRPPDIRVGAAPVVVPAGRTDPLELDLVLVPAGEIRVQVDDAAIPPVPPDADETGAEPPRACAVEFLAAGPAGPAGSGAPAESRVALERGFWRGGGVGASVAPGDYIVVLHVPGQVPRRASVTVRAGESALVVFPER